MDALPPPSAIDRAPRPGALLPLLLAGLLLVRLPLLTAAFCGEDGLFAMMAVNTTGAPVPDPNRPFLTAKAGKKSAWSIPAHPILPYWIPVLLLRPLTDGVDFASLSLNARSALARGLYLLFFPPVLLVLFLLAGWVRRLRAGADASHAWLALALLAYIGCCRPLLMGSVQPQQDGSYGVMQAAFVVLFLLLAGRARSVAGRTACCLAAGFLGGLGKQEWSLALLAAAGCVTFLWCLRRRLVPAREAAAGEAPFRSMTGAALGLALGLGAGNVVSYLADPVNYLAGIHVIFYFAGHGRDWIEINLHRLPRLYHLVLLLPLTVFLAWRHRSRLLHCRPLVLLVFFFGLALTAGFSLNAVSTKTRYFCPGYFALLAFALMTLEHAGFHPRRARALAWLFAVLCVCDLGYSYARVETLSPGTRARRKLDAAVARTRTPGVIPLVSSYVPYYRPGVDYLNSSGYRNTPEDLRRAREYYRKLRDAPATE